MVKQAWFISFIRFPLLLAALLLLFLFMHLSGLQFHFPFLPELSVFYFTVVNVLCFFILQRILKKEGRSLTSLIGFRRDRWTKDVLYGFVWLFVLYIPFVATVMGTMFAMYKTDLFQHFQATLVGDEVLFTYDRPQVLMWFTAGISLLFPFLNAPIEELMYRGYAQPAFIQHFKRVWPGIVIPSLGFALQHIMLAGSWQGMIVYGAAFFVWGIGSGLIYQWQRTLFPLIVTHFIINMAFSVLPIVFILTG